MRNLPKVLNIKDQNGKDIDVTLASENSLIEILGALQVEIISLSSIIRDTEKDLSKHKKELDRFLLDMEIVDAQLSSIENQDVEKQ